MLVTTSRIDRPDSRSVQSTHSYAMNMHINIQVNTHPHIFANIHDNIHADIERYEEALLTRPQEATGSRMASFNKYWISFSHASIGFLVPAFDLGTAQHISGTPSRWYFGSRAKMTTPNQRHIGRLPSSTRWGKPWKPSWRAGWLTWRTPMGSFPAVILEGGSLY